jgi:hypothetical protein
MLRFLLASRQACLPVLMTPRMSGDTFDELTSAPVYYFGVECEPSDDGAPSAFHGQFHAEASLQRWLTALQEVFQNSEALLEMVDHNNDEQTSSVPPPSSSHPPIAITVTAPATLDRISTPVLVPVVSAASELPVQSEPTTPASQAADPLDTLTPFALKPRTLDEGAAVSSSSLDEAVHSSPIPVEPISEAATLAAPSVPDAEITAAVDWLSASSPVQLFLAAPGGGATAATPALLRYVYDNGELGSIVWATQGDAAPEQSISFLDVADVTYPSNPTYLFLPL